MTTKLRVGVVGVGHFGRHHARIYSELDDVELVGVADCDAERAAEAARRTGTRVFTDYHDLIDKVDAVSVAVPTRLHMTVSCDFLSRGVSVLVEKPMAGTLAEARKMQAAAVKSGTALQVGLVCRFSPFMTVIRDMDIEPKFIEVHRLGPFSFRSLDVGVVLDMMIHDIDLVLQLAHGRPERVDAVAFPIVGKTEDICNARIAFDDGCVANLTASRVALKTMRKIRIFSPDSYISMDFDRNNGLIIKKSQDFSLDAIDVDKMRGLSLDQLKGMMVDQFFTVREMKIDEVEPLKAELASFVDCVRNRRTPLVPAEDGIRSMEAAESILEAVRAHKWHR
ncbi:MAG TPA: Gfo/Idh/MocA family oxidoreductase [Planctomycetota bacterium]|nr:Gfo/Idh/MocA family oxidoreductase [Planctomycetota bacterium]